jgi:AcrR family transcriptional regulator
MQEANRMDEEPRPKFRRRAEARPDEILDAALALFTERGFAATKVDDIAAAAGLSKGAVYLYFPSKEALLEGLVHRAVEPVADLAVARLSDRSDHPHVTLARAMGAVAGAMANERIVAVPLLILREAPALPRIAEVYREAILSKVIPALSALVADGIARGQLRPVDPDLAVRTLVGPLIVHMLLARVFGIMPEGGLALDRLIETHLSIVFDGLSARTGEQA